MLDVPIVVVGASTMLLVSAEATVHVNGEAIISIIANVLMHVRNFFNFSALTL